MHLALTGTQWLCFRRLHYMHLDLAVDNLRTSVPCKGFKRNFVAMVTVTITNIAVTSMILIVMLSLVISYWPKRLDNL